MDKNIEDVISIDSANSMRTLEDDRVSREMRLLHARRAEYSKENFAYEVLKIFRQK